jgi:hypothetical protein
MKIHFCQYGNMPLRTILAVTLVVGALVFSGCAPDLAVSGGAGDDFPNSKTALGRVIGDNMSVVGEWKNLSAIPDSVDQAIFAGDTLLNSVTTDTAAGLGKSAAGVQAIDSVLWDYSDTLQGTATYIHIKTDWLTAKTDTVVVRYDDYAKDAVLGNETIVHLHGTITNQLSGAVTIYDVRDADSNGYLDSAYIMQATNELVRTRYNAAYGSWGNQSGIWDGSHIRVSCLELVYKVGTDTMTFYQLSDRDGDGQICVQGQTNQIRFVYKYKNPLALLPRTAVEGRLMLDGGLVSGSTTRFTADRLGAYYLYRDGTHDTVTITCENPDSLLSGHDTIRVKCTRFPSDRLLYDSLTVQLVLAPDSAAAGYGLARISLAASINGANIKELRCSFIPDAPMLPGQLLKFSPGNFNAAIVYQRGGQGTLSGRFSDGIFLLRYTAADGTTQDVSFSQDGTVIE